MNWVGEFNTFLAYCCQYDLKVEFWDVHFCQGWFKQLQTNEKNKAKKYHNAFRAFNEPGDDEFAEALDNMRYLNSW